MKYLHLLLSLMTLSSTVSSMQFNNKQEIYYPYPDRPDVFVENGVEYVDVSDLKPTLKVVMQ